MQRYNGQLLNQFPNTVTGISAAGAKITVRVKSTGALATLYATNSTSGATLDNPLTADGKGYYGFYAPDGVYTLDVSLSGTPQLEIQLQDVASLQSQFNDAVSNAGYIPVGTFAAGCTVSQANGVVSDGVSYWRWDGALPKPVTAGSSPAPTGVGGWFLVSDGAFRDSLANSNSTDLVGGVEARLLAKRWITPEDFGAVGDGTADDADAILDARDYAISTGSPLALGKIYGTSQEIDLTNCRIVYANNTTIIPLMDTTSEAVIKYKGSQGGTLEDRQLLGALTVVWPDADWSKQRTSFFFRNCYAGEFHIGSKRATRAIYAQGWDSGTVHCDFHIKQMWQNCVGVWLGSVNSNGWCNANRFHGGFFFGSKSVTGALYSAQAGHIYLESTPYQVNGNVFLYPSIEWVGISGPDFMLARMGGTRNKLFIGYCEYNDAATGNARPTRWMLDVGLKNMIDATCVPYAIGYDPTIFGVNNRIDVSGAQEPFVRGAQGYVDASGEGTQNYVNNSLVRATMALRNVGGGAALIVQGGVKTEGYAPMIGNTSQALSRIEEVSFSPSVVGSVSAGAATYDKRAATVQRINNTVRVVYSLKWSGHTGSGDFRVTLPVASSETPSDFIALADCLWVGYSLGANKQLKGLVNPNTNYVTLYAVSDDTGGLSLVTLPTTGELYLTCEYAAG